MNLQEAIDMWRERHPNFDEVAADHRVGCSCPDCICFVDAVGREVEDEDWLMFQADVTVDFTPFEIVQPYIPDDRLAEYREIVNNL